MLVIGAGAAGMMCAVTAAQAGAHVTVLERNDKIGRKLYITGKGRCNVTNDCTGQAFLANIVGNARFLYSSLAQFDSADTMRFFTQNGVPLKVERGNRVYPASDKSSDIIDALFVAAGRCGVHIRFGATVLSVAKQQGGYRVVTTQGEFFDPIVVVATGGVSYPATGSTGDGYAFARCLGHEVIAPVGALVGLRCPDTQSFSGLSLRNVRLDIVRRDTGETVASQFGEMLYTHTGISGPIVLTLSSYINRMDYALLNAVLDLKPAVSVEQLQDRLLQDLTQNSNKQLGNAVKGYLPKAMVSDWLRRADVDPTIPCHSVTKSHRAAMASALKGFVYPLLGPEPIEGAIVTAGGVDVRGINPKTMESKISPGLYWAGEVIDIDALTGGFNLQLAFTTGYCAGIAAAAKEKQLC